MNIITLINTALSALGQTATVSIMEKSRAENEELDNEKTAIVVFPDWTTETNIGLGLEVMKNRRYNIVFKKQDEYDNSDGDSSVYGLSTADIIDSMELLADSVFFHIQYGMNSYPNIIESLDWRFTKPILRQGNGTMSGVQVQLTIKFTGAVICPTA